MPISSSSSKTTRGHCGSWGPNTPTQHVNINSKRRTTRGNKEPELVFGLWMMCGVAEDEKSHPTLCFCCYLDYWCISQHEWIVAHLVNCCVLYRCCSFSFLLLAASNCWIRRLTRSRALHNTLLFIWDTNFDPFNNVSLWAWRTWSGTTLPEALPSSHNDTHTHSLTHPHSHTKAPTGHFQRRHSVGRSLFQQCPALWLIPLRWGWYFIWFRSVKCQEWTH